MLSNDDNTDCMKWVESWPQKTNWGPAWEGASQKWKDRKSWIVWGNGILSELCTNVCWTSFLPMGCSCLLDLHSCLYFPLNWTAPPSSTFSYCSWGSQGKNAEVACHSLFQGTTFCLLRVPWAARKSNHSILTEINTDYSSKDLMLKLKLQYFGHLMRRTDSLEKTLMLGKTEGKEKRVTEGEMVGWHHRLNGHKFEQTLGDSEGQGSLACCRPWSHKGSDTT